MRILFPASEVVPFSKTGGLADVSGALPHALAARGHDLRIVTPLYRSVSREGLREGNLVVASAGSSLRDGDKVKPVMADAFRPRRP